MSQLLTVNISATPPVSSYVKHYGPFLIKGLTQVDFTLDGLQEDLNPIIYNHFSFGDGSSYSNLMNLNIDLSTMNMVQVVQSGKTKSVNQTVTHHYQKSDGSTMTELSAVCTVYYTSQAVGQHVIAFKHIKDSYYDSIKNLYMLNTQMLPVSANDVFAQMSDETGNVFNMYIAKDNISLPTTTETAATSAYILSTQNCTLLRTQQLKLMLVAKLSA